MCGRTISAKMIFHIRRCFAMPLLEATRSRPMGYDVGLFVEHNATRNAGLIKDQSV
jgi:hypothetical protein